LPRRKIVTHCSCNNKAINTSPTSKKNLRNFSLHTKQQQPFDYTIQTPACFLIGQVQFPESVVSVAQDSDSPKFFAFKLILVGSENK
jgi:hypothetical protein